MELETLRKANELARQHEELQERFRYFQNNRNKWKAVIVDVTPEGPGEIMNIESYDFDLKSFLDKKAEKLKTEMRRVEEQIEAL